MKSLPFIAINFGTGNNHLSPSPRPSVVVSTSLCDKKYSFKIFMAGQMFYRQAALSRAAPFFLSIYISYIIIYLSICKIEISINTFFWKQKLEREQESAGSAQLSVQMNS